MNQKCIRCSKNFDTKRSPVCPKCGKCNCAHDLAHSSHEIGCQCKECKL